LRIRLHKSDLLAAIVTLVVFVSRLPFLKAGYGRDPDAWRLANTAYSIAATGRYSVSREPGYPVPELSYAALSGVHSWWLPLVALLCALAAGVFALILRRLGSRDYVLGGLALGFTPTVFIHSTTLMDYTWALAAVLAALLALMHRRYLAAGVLTGVAIGCRITSGVVLLPFLVLILFRSDGFDRASIRSAIELTVGAGVTAFVLYLPGLKEYGIGLFTYVEDSPGIGVIIRASTVRVWGTLGTVAIVLALIGGVVNKALGSRLDTTFAARQPEPVIAAWLTALGAFLLVYVQLPGVAGYLITAIPFVLLCLALFVPRPLFWVVCGALILSPFVEFDRSGFHEGLILRDRELREISMDKAHNILRSVDHLQSEKVLLIAGRLTLQLEAMSTEAKLYDRRQKLVITYTVDRSQLATYLAGGFDAYYVPDHDIYPNSAVILDWLDGGAQPLAY
jgi:hypothetical protein